MKKHMIYNHIPDFCLFGFGFAALAVAWTWPGTVVIASEWWLVGAACIVVAVFIMHATMRALRRAATSTNPLDEPSELLTTGPFNFSRNPLYLAYILAVLGCALVSGSWLALLCPVVYFGVLNWLIIPIEEHAIHHVFDERYEWYCRRVRRWLVVPMACKHMKPMRFMTIRRAARPYIFAAISGIIVAGTAFAPHWLLQLPVFFALALLFIAVRRLSGVHLYGVGACFMLAWLLPTTYWYYYFMSPGVAFGASVGWALLQANLFWIIALRRYIRTYGAVVLFVIAWCTLTYIRTHAPVVEDWWIPHLGYSVWRNDSITMWSAYGGEAVLEAIVLLCGVSIAWLIVHARMSVWIRMSCGLVVLVAIANSIVVHMPAKPLPPVIALQKMTRGGVDIPATKADVDDLIHLTKRAIAQYQYPHATIVWPENYIPPALHTTIAAFAQKESINIVYHTTEKDDTRLYKKVVLVDQSGRSILTNYKAHLAPDESIGTARYSRVIATHNATKVTAYICYDMHYPDIVERLKGSDVAYIPLDDAEYGYLQKQFHAADSVIHARQAQTAVVLAGTDGPTMIINSNGIIVDRLMGNATGFVGYSK